jgi:hypothetical protein
VLPLTMGSPAYAGIQVLSAAIRQFMMFVVWAVMAALIAAAVCWCCGAGARAAWGHVGPPARRDRREPADDVGREADRGIHDIERYLSAQAEPR